MSTEKLALAYEKYITGVANGEPYEELLTHFCSALSESSNAASERIAQLEAVTSKQAARIVEQEAKQAAMETKLSRFEELLDAAKDALCILESLPGEQAQYAAQRLAESMVYVSGKRIH